MKLCSHLDLVLAWTTNAILLVCFGPGNLIIAQAINPDTVLFTTIAIWPDLRTCLQSCFDTSYGIQYQVGCKTNACLCRPDTLGQAIISIEARASSSCQALQDISSASSILTSYCGDKGYTSIIQPTILASGSCTVGSTRTVTATAFVTQTITVRSTSAPRTAAPSTQDLCLVWVLAAVSVVLLQAPQQQLPNNPAAATTLATTTTTTPQVSNSPNHLPSTTNPLQTSSMTLLPSSFSPSSTKPLPSSSSSNSVDPSPTPTSTDSSASSFSTPEIVGTIIGVASAIVAIITLIVNWQTLLLHFT